MSDVVCEAFVYKLGRAFHTHVHNGTNFCHGRNSRCRICSILRLVVLRTFPAKLFSLQPRVACFIIIAFEDIALKRTIVGSTNS